MKYSKTSSMAPVHCQLQTIQGMTYRHTINTNNYDFLIISVRISLNRNLKTILAQIKYMNTVSIHVYMKGQIFTTHISLYPSLSVKMIINTYQMIINIYQMIIQYKTFTKISTLHNYVTLTLLSFLHGL